MANTKTNWTTDDVANRFQEAASTARRLPPVRVQGYFTQAALPTQPQRGGCHVGSHAMGAVAGGGAASPRVDESQALWLAGDQPPLWMLHQDCPAQVDTVTSTSHRATQQCLDGPFVSLKGIGGWLEPKPTADYPCGITFKTGCRISQVIALHLQLWLREV